MTAPTTAGLVAIVPVDEFIARIRSEFDDALASQAPKPEPALLSTPQLAEKFGCSRAKIHKLAERGDLPFVWLGDERRFDFAECVAALKVKGRVAK